MKKLQLTELQKFVEINKNEALTIFGLGGGISTGALSSTHSDHSEHDDYSTHTDTSEFKDLSDYND